MGAEISRGSPSFASAATFLSDSMTFDGSGALILASARCSGFEEHATTRTHNGTDKNRIQLFCRWRVSGGRFNLSTPVQWRPCSLKAQDFGEPAAGRDASMQMAVALVAKRRVQDTSPLKRSIPGPWGGFIGDLEEDRSRPVKPTPPAIPSRTIDGFLLCERPARP